MLEERLANHAAINLASIISSGISTHAATELAAFTQGKAQHMLIAFFTSRRVSRIRVALSLGIHLSVLSNAGIVYARLADYRMHSLSANIQFSYGWVVVADLRSKLRPCVDMNVLKLGFALLGQRRRDEHVV